MKRNRERYEYTELSLLKSGALHQLLMADAQMLGQSLSQTILMRLALSYGLLAPGISTQQPNVPAPPTSLVVQEAPELQQEQREQGEEPVFDMDAAMRNADLFGL